MQKINRYQGAGTQDLAILIGKALSAAYAADRRPGRAKTPSVIKPLGSRACSAWHRLIRRGAKEQAATQAVRKLCGTSLIDTLEVDRDGNIEVRLHRREGQKKGMLITTIS